MSLVPMAAFWALATFCFFGPPHRLFYLMFGAMSFGSFAVVPPQLTAGLTFTAAPIAALLIIGRMFLAPGGIRFALTAAFTPRRMTLLFLFLVTAWVLTLFMPRLLKRQIEVIPVRGDVTETALLVPTPQNLSQLLYVTISVLAVVAFAYLMRSAALREHALKAMCFGAAVAVGTGLLDFASQFLPLRPVLDVFRTGTYAFLVDVQVLGGKRVVGLMPEASAYGNLCVAFALGLYFLRRAINDVTVRDVYAPALLFSVAMMIWLAKSTSAYVGLGLLVGLAGLNWLIRFARARRNDKATSGLRTEFWFAFLGVMGFVFLTLFQPAVLEPIFAIIERMVLTKAESHSYEERGMWRAVAWQAFLDSGGIGIGVGSTRASSAIVSLFSAVGILGALFYYGFLAQTLSRRAAPGDREGRLIISAFGWIMLPELIVGFFVGSVDFGLFNAFVLGLVTAAGTARAPRPLRAQPLAPAPVGSSPRLVPDG